MSAQILERISVRWLPDPAYEDTETIALNVGGYFVDLRVTKEESAVQWSRAGERIILKHEPLTCRWTHIIDSLDLTEPDEAYFTKLPNGDDLEIGVTKCPFRDGAMTPYEEVWRDVTPKLRANDPSWIIQSSNGSIFVGKVGNNSVAMRKDPEGGFVVRKEKLSQGEKSWKTSYESGDTQGIPRISDFLQELDVGNLDWCTGQVLTLGKTEYIIRGWVGM
ncbi:Fc.00g054970.m01.CDS01 [Cosmosporella sp. VM-42]